MDPKRNDPNPNRGPGDPKKPKGNLPVTLIVTVAVILLIAVIEGTEVK